MPGWAATTARISRSTRSGTPRPTSNSRFACNNTAEAESSSTPMSAPATVSAVGLPVS